MQDLGNEIRGRRHGGNGTLRPDEFRAVDNVSFQLERGECLGLIGSNGASKTIPGTKRLWRWVKKVAVPMIDDIIPETRYRQMTDELRQASAS